MHIGSWFITNVPLKKSKKRKVFSINGPGTIRYPYRKKKMNLDSYTTLYTKIKSRWIVHINIKGKTIKL